MKTIEMDIRGQVCPSSLLLALRSVNENYAQIASGDLKMVILTDNRAATGTIPDAVENMGVAAEVEKADGYYRIVLQQQRGL